MADYYSEKKYEGPETIVVAMDIGTTQSAVSFAHFSPGRVVQSKMLTLWPGCSTTVDKIPSIVSYRNGIVRACGAEALQDLEEQQDNVAYRFKSHMHPSLISQPNPLESELPPFPAGVTIEQVYADMMRYLMDNTQKSFEKSSPKGGDIWARVRDTIVIVLVTPNTWDIREQSRLRLAAIRASLVTEENAGHLLQFVAESEASVLYALVNHPGDWLQRNTVFAVVDCGGSTVDTAVYRCVSTNPISLNETCPSECVQTGGIVVNCEVTKMLNNKLQGSVFNDQEIIVSMVNAFEREVKPRFDGTQDRYYLNFGASIDNDPSVGIERGRIALSNEDLKPAFDVVTDMVCKNCSEVLPGQKAEYVLLVGGFGDSPYVQKVLSEKLRAYHIELLTVEDYGRKAVVEGAIIGHIKQFVAARAANATFGGCVRPVYDKKLHRDRKHLVQLYPDGKKRIDGAFHVWIEKGAILQGNFAHKLPYHVAWDAAKTSKNELIRGLETVEIEVFAWEGSDIPTWCKDEYGSTLKGMRLICTLSANLSALAGSLQIVTGHRGKKIYRVEYDVCVYFGGTQLRAKLQWHQGSTLHESEVKVMPYVFRV
ncbi:hypothetical protein M408DRAFT_332321 [Serendipita vermifera MAFF 305830]|uniref:Actin-like ATPase domain-containing protein n=1 Tax=Serendipita vermifera MAFF 305830 TaxID=933852 RepID=A0A0C3AFP6_SERVB|nr:hypothetical protein M408DRAFT_332321 [Serendipita vermifera MAFF 305830]